MNTEPPKTDDPLGRNTDTSGSSKPAGFTGFRLGLMSWCSDETQPGGLAARLPGGGNWYLLHSLMLAGTTTIPQNIGYIHSGTVGSAPCLDGFFPLFAG